MINKRKMVWYDVVLVLGMDRERKEGVILNEKPKDLYIFVEREEREESSF
jgi:hypothetical protein